MLKLFVWRDSRFISAKCPRMTQTTLVLISEPHLSVILVLDTGIWENWEGDRRGLGEGSQLSVLFLVLFQKIIIILKIFLKQKKWFDFFWNWCWQNELEWKDGIIFLGLKMWVILIMLDLSCILPYIWLIWKKKIETKLIENFWLKSWCLAHFPRL